MGMFTPRTETGACVPQYVKNEAQARFQLNAIPINFINGIAEIYFPRPFQIIGLCTSPPNDLPEAGAKWPQVSIFPLPPADQANYSDLSPLLMLEFAVANMRVKEDNNLYPVTYLKPGIQGRDYRGYFSKFLNDDLMQSRGQWFNTFMMPTNLWKRFALLNTSALDVEWFGKFQEFVQFIQRTSDQRLYGAPGVYNMQDQLSVFNFNIDNEYLFIQES